MPGDPAIPGPIADRAARLDDIDAVQQALIRHARSLDEHDIETFLALFDDSFRYSYNGAVSTDREKLGRAARRNWESTPKTTHQLGNVIVRLEDGAGAATRASATSDCLALTVAKDGAMELVTATYTDRLVKRGGDWRFAERVIETGGPFALGKAPG